MRHLLFRPARRRYLAVGVAVSAVSVLVAGCQQPTPSVTVQSGSRIVRDDATAYIRNGKEIRGSGPVKVLAVRAGAQVGIDVDGTIADHGWSVHITPRTSGSSSSSANTLDSPLLKGQYHFTFDVGSTTTDIVIAEQGSGGQPQGLWAFTLQPSLQ